MITQADLERLRHALELGASAPELLAVAEELAALARLAERERRARGWWKRKGTQREWRAERAKARAEGDERGVEGADDGDRPA